MKIAIVTLFTEEIADYGAIGAANKQAYGRRHGYDCFVYRERLDTRRHPAWSKLVAIKRHLPDYDWVFWTDADSLVMNGEQTLEAIIAKQKNKDMILTWEAGASPVNTGQWLIRNTEWSSATLSAIEDPACSNSRPKWFEQGALIEWLKADERRWSHLALLHPRVMNSTPPVALYDHLSVRRSRFRRGDFIIHFWPLARRQEAVLDMMIEYDALSKSPPPRFTWRSLSRLKFDWPGRASARLHKRASRDEL
jgi:galactosyl transferase GMA12/MNN10 family